MVSIEFSSIAKRILELEKYGGMKNGLVRCFEKVCDLEDPTERKVLTKIIFSKAAEKDYMNLEVMRGLRGLEDIVRELEKIGYMVLWGRLYTDVDKFYENEFCGRVDPFVCPNNSHSNGLITAEAIVRFPECSATADKEVKEVYKDCVYRELKRLFKGYDILNVDYIETAAVNHINFYLVGTYKLKATLRINESESK